MVMRDIKKLFSFLCFAIILSSGIAQSLQFRPAEITRELRKKSFFKEGIIFHADKVSFKNDTNRFTLYLINNSKEPLTLMTIDGEDVYDVTLYNMPRDSSYQPILKMYWQWVTCGNSYGIDTLYPGMFLKTEVALACPNCSANNKKRVKFFLGTYSNWLQNDPDGNYFSNAFDIYYDKKTFDKHQNPFWAE
jgi:hypothetical protein